MEEKTDYDNDLEEAIKMSLTNFSAKPKKSQVSPFLEEEKAEETLFKAGDLLTSLQVDSDREEEEKTDNPFFEETKEAHEEISKDPPKAISQPSEAYPDPLISLCKEYMVVLETRINDTKEFNAVLSILSKLIGNVLKDPNNSKFHKIKLNNKKIQNTVGKYAPGLFLLELVGFRLSKEEEVIDQFTTQTVDVYNLDYDNFNLDIFEFLSNLIKEKIGSKGSGTTTGEFKVIEPPVEQPKTFQTMEGYNNKYVPMNSKRRRACEKMSGKGKDTKSMLYDLAQQREMRKMTNPQLYTNNPYNVYNVPQEDSGSSVMDQLNLYRRQKKDDYRPNKEITVKDLEKMNKDASMNVGPNDIKRLGIRALELSNNFRATEGKPALAWNDELYKIAMTHSKNMADGVVPVGHDGFKDRMNKVPYYFKSFSENVAWNSNSGDPVETAVIGWINSPGHRKNLLSTSSHCAIAVYCVCGNYYFTQLFTLS